jgi:hypothetical protein
LAGIIESIGRLGAAEAGAVEKELSDLRKRISKLERVHGT